MPSCPDAARLAAADDTVRLDVVRALLARQWPGLDMTVTPVARGANSRVHRVDGPAGRFALKLYPRRAGDPRDRLGAEREASLFLHRHGAGPVPAFIAGDGEQALALYEWIDGSAVGAVGDDEIAAALNFAATLHRLRTADGADALPLASEACLSPTELVGQVRRRLARLREGPAVDHPELGVFLTRKVETELERRLADTAGRWADGDLPPARRTLNPSDFGFHNARRRPDGRLVFHDLEYFGWDDPVKLAADFALHPGMTLTVAQRRDFLAGCARLYGDDGDYAERLAALAPLYALRWCLILLNDFFPDRRDAHRRAGLDPDVVAARQLAKAAAMLHRAQAPDPLTAETGRHDG